MYGSRPVERRLESIQDSDVDLAGLACLLDEDRAEEKQNIETIVLRSWSDDDVDGFLDVLQSEWNSETSHACMQRNSTPNQ